MVLVISLTGPAERSLYAQADVQGEVCQSAPARLLGGAIHLLRIEVLSSGPTDGTYADEGYGQGEFDTVRLLGVVKSPIRWRKGLIFRVHPFSGERQNHRNLAPEHLVVGKRYYIVYTYHLDEEPHGDADLIGLTRCAVHDDSEVERKQLLSELSH
jgi:hypothetical protein